MLLHPDRYHTTTTLQKKGIVVHDSESGDGSSAVLIGLLQKPGNIPSPSRPGGFYGSGYHAVTDGLGGYVVIADNTAAPNSAPPLNDSWWHVCMPGFAAQTRAEWLDELSMKHIRGVAKFIHDKWIADSKTYQPVFRNHDQLVAGATGYTSHYQVSLAWHKTTHYDPGPNFPFDVLQAEVSKLTNPSEEDEMNTARLVRFSGFVNVFLCGGGGPAQQVGGADFEHLVNQGVPKIFMKATDTDPQGNQQEFLSVCKQAGLNPTDPTQLVSGGSLEQF